jgi:hypothetical protein
MSPTARALAQLRKEGWLPAVVERWNPGARVRQDFLGFADILAVNERVHGGVLAVQVTTQAHVGDRFTKITTPPVSARTTRWLWSDNTLEIWGYAKRGPRGKRKTWRLTRRVVTLRDLSGGEEGA